MKRRYLAAIIAPLLLIPHNVTATFAAPNAVISNISPNKQLVQPSGILKVSWNFSSEDITLTDARKMEVLLTPVSGAPCPVRCPYGVSKIISGTAGAGLWQAFIDIPPATMQTDYEITVAYPGLTSAKSQTTVKISNEQSPLDTVRVLPTISGTGWAPSIGAITRRVTGFTFKVLNFNTDYTWSYSAVNGFASLDGEGNFIVRDLPPGFETEVTIQTRSSAGVMATAKFKERSLLSPPTQVEVKLFPLKKDRIEFSFKPLEPYASTNYTIEAVNGRKVFIDYSYSEPRYVLDGLEESSTAAIEIFSKRFNGEDGYALIIGSTLPKPAPVVVTTPSPTPTPSPSLSPTPSPSPSLEPTPTPSVKATKTIMCVKGKTTKKVTNYNPKCPKGYKKKIIS